MNAMIEKMITRHAIRRFEDRPLDEEALSEILTAGLYAPSAGNNQNSRIVVSTDKEVNRRLGELSQFSALLLRWASETFLPVHESTYSHHLQ